MHFSRTTTLTKNQCSSKQAPTKTLGAELVRWNLQPNCRQARTPHEQLQTDGFALTISIRQV